MTGLHDPPRWGNSVAEEVKLWQAQIPLEGGGYTADVVTDWVINCPSLDEGDVLVIVAAVHWDMDSGVSSGPVFDNEPEEGVAFGNSSRRLKSCSVYAWVYQILDPGLWPSVLEFSLHTRKRSSELSDPIVGQLAYAMSALVYSSPEPMEVQFLTPNKGCNVDTLTVAEYDIAPGTTPCEIMLHAQASAGNHEPREADGDASPPFEGRSGGVGYVVSNSMPVDFGNWNDPWSIGGAETIALHVDDSTAWELSKVIYDAGGGIWGEDDWVIERIDPGNIGGFGHVHYDEGAEHIPENELNFYGDGWTTSGLLAIGWYEVVASEPEPEPEPPTTSVYYGSPFAPPFQSRCTVTYERFDEAYDDCFIRFPKVNRTSLAADDTVTIEDIAPGTVFEGHVAYGAEVGYQDEVGDDVTAEGWSGLAFEDVTSAITKQEHGGWNWVVGTEATYLITFAFEPTGLESSEARVRVRASDDRSAVRLGNRATKQANRSHSIHPLWSDSAQLNSRNGVDTDASALEVPNHENDLRLAGVQFVEPITEDVVVVYGPMTIEVPTETEGTTLEDTAGGLADPRYDYVLSTAYDEDLEQWVQVHSSGFYMVAAKVGADGMLGTFGTPVVVMNSQHAYTGGPCGLARVDDTRVCFLVPNNDAGLEVGLARVNLDTLAITLGDTSEIATGVAQDPNTVGVVAVNDSCVVVGCIIEEADDGKPLTEWWEPLEASRPIGVEVVWYPHVVSVWFDGLTVGTTAAADLYYPPVAGNEIAIDQYASWQHDMLQLSSNRAIWVASFEHGSGVATVIQVDNETNDFSYQANLFAPALAVQRVLSAGWDVGLGIGYIDPTDLNAGYQYGSARAVNAHYVLAIGNRAENASYLVPEEAGQSVIAARLLKVDGMSVSVVATEEIGRWYPHANVVMSDSYAMVHVGSVWYQRPETYITHFVLQGYKLGLKFDLGSDTLEVAQHYGPYPAFFEIDDTPTET